MVLFLRSYIFSPLAFIILTFSTLSCKKQEAVPEDMSGTLDATFSPAGSVGGVVLTVQGTGSTATSGTVDPAGYVKLTGISPGNYVATFQTTSGYTVPAPQNVIILAKANTALGTIKVSPANTSVPYALTGTVGWTSTLTATGAASTATGAAAAGSITFYNGNPTGLTIRATSTSGTVGETVTINTNYSGAGQYSLGNVTGAGIGSYLRTSGGATTNSYDTNVSGIQGTLTVTAHDQTKRTLTGTFGFNGYDSRATKGVTVSTGTFNLSY